MNKLIGATVLITAWTLAPAARAQDFKKIHDYLFSLNNDANLLLSTMAPGTTESHPGKSNAGKAVIVCTQKEVDLSSELDGLTILSMNSATIVPGELLRANRRLAEGVPDIVSLEQGPIRVSLDLPNMGADGSRAVDKPTPSSVQAAIQQIADTWARKPGNAKAGQAARMTFEVTKAYESQQVALKLGFNVKWDKNNSFGLDAGFKQNGESSTTFMMFRQIYYTATVDPPTDVASVFAPTVTLDQVKEHFDAQDPAAYVQSVDYGRILMVRMDTQSSETEADLSTALKMVTGATPADPKIDAKLKAHYEDIISKSNFKVIALGGNAAKASTLMEASGTKAEETLPKVIKASATFGPSNPAVAIGYKVNFLKRNERAILGCPYHYTQWDCKEYNVGFVKLVHNGGYVGKFEVNWQEAAINKDPGSKNPNDTTISYVNKSWASGNQTAGYTFTLTLPGDATNVNIRGLADTGLAWNRWQEALNVTESGPTQKTYTISGTTLNRKNSITGP
jgi:thiol-activated cytolysin